MFLVGGCISRFGFNVVGGLFVCLCLLLFELFPGGFFVLS